MSRGLGPVQRAILDILEANLPQGDSPVGKLKAALGGDRSNTRRAIRGLMRRGLVEEAQDEMGNRLIRLTDFGALVSGPPLTIPKESATYPSREWERWRATVGRRTADGTSARQNVFGRPSPVRARAPGSIEQRILAVLREYSRPLAAGMPAWDLKVLVGGDKSNIRRAIRNLLRRGWIEESSDGCHLRLTHRGYFSIVLSPIPDGDPLDEPSR